MVGALIEQYSGDGEPDRDTLALITSAPALQAEFLDTIAAISTPHRSDRGPYRRPPPGRTGAPGARRRGIRRSPDSQPAYRRVPARQEPLGATPARPVRSAGNFRVSGRAPSASIVARICRTYSVHPSQSARWASTPSRHPGGRAPSSRSVTRSTSSRQTTWPGGATSAGSTTGRAHPIDTTSSTPPAVHRRSAANRSAARPARGQASRARGRTAGTAPTTWCRPRTTPRPGWSRAPRRATAARRRSRRPACRGCSGCVDGRARRRHALPLCTSVTASPVARGWPQAGPREPDRTGSGAPRMCVTAAGRTRLVMPP